MCNKHCSHIIRPADDGSGHSPLCPDEHQQNDRLDLNILTEYTLSEFDDQFRPFIARLLYHRCCQYKAIDISKFLKTNAKANREYCSIIIHQLGWGRMMKQNKRDYDASCVKLLGVKFHPTLNESGLDGEGFGGDLPVLHKHKQTVCRPLNRQTIEFDLDYWADRLLRKQQHTRSAALVHLARNSHFEQFRQIINKFDGGMRARTMARTLNVIDLFGEMMKILLRMYWTEFSKIGFKQVLIERFVENGSNDMFCSKSEYDSLAKIFSDCGELISELQRLMFRQESLIHHVHAPVNHPVQQQEDITKKGPKEKLEIEDDNDNSNELEMAPPPTGPITYPYGEQIAGKGFIRRTLNVIEDLNECLTTLTNSRDRLNSMQEWNDNHKPLGMYIVNYTICLLCIIYITCVFHIGCVHCVCVHNR